MNPNKTTNSKKQNRGRKNTAGRKTLAAILTGTALTLALAGCGSRSALAEAETAAEKSAEVTTSETQQAAAQESTQAPAEQATVQAAESSTEDAAAIDFAPLTEGLTDMADKYSQGAFAGISFQSAVTAAKMLDWYVTQKPSDAAVTEAVKSAVSEDAIDTAMLQNGLAVVYSAAEDTLTDTGALETGGWNKGVSWDEADISALFGDICEGAGIEMPKN